MDLSELLTKQRRVTKNLAQPTIFERGNSKQDSSTHSFQSYVLDFSRLFQVKALEFCSNVCFRNLVVHDDVFFDVCHQCSI